VQKRVNRTGKYERVDQTATINVTALPRGRLYVSGQAILVINAAMERVRTGSIEGTFPLQGLVLNYQEESLENSAACQLTITFSTETLQVSNDNEQCGGVVVSFNAEYKQINRKIR
jgi:hypothetical protein